MGRKLLHPDTKCISQIIYAIDKRENHDIYMRNINYVRRRANAENRKIGERTVYQPYVPRSVKKRHAPYTDGKPQCRRHTYQVEMGNTLMASELDWHPIKNSAPRTWVQWATRNKRNRPFPIEESTREVITKIPKIDPPTRNRQFIRIPYRLFKELATLLLTSHPYCPSRYTSNENTEPLERPTCNKIRYGKPQLTKQGKQTNNAHLRTGLE